MAFTDFLTKWNGKYIDFDGIYGNQCMDLMHQYCVEVLGITDGSILAADCAKNVYLNFQTIKGHELFEQIPNTPTGVPQEGDIVLWGNTTYGHVAIFISGDTNNFTSFDQNWPTSSPCHNQGHTYTNVLGWLRYKGGLNDSLQKQLDDCRMERDRNWNFFATVCAALGVGTNVDQAVIEVKKLVALEDSYNQKDKQLTEATAQIAELNNKAQSLMTSLSIVQDELNVKQSENEQLQKTVNDKVAEVSSLQKSLQELTAQITKPVYSGWKATLIKLIQNL